MDSDTFQNNVNNCLRRRISLLTTLSNLAKFFFKLRTRRDQNRRLTDHTVFHLLGLNCTWTDPSVRKFVSPLAEDKLFPRFPSSPQN